uniref:Uncharacterized protein n=1 Tax=Oryza brachyantha TaxID=4533 RepID=J3MEN6_ORYBR
MITKGDRINARWILRELNSVANDLAYKGRLAWKHISSVPSFLCHNQTHTLHVSQCPCARDLPQSF